ncbi:hypothetical protein GCM10027047_01610 [Rhodococcus aerolatus]
MTTPLVSVGDGPRTTVADLVGNPLMIPTRVYELLVNTFLSEAILRDAGANPNGLVQFHESTPLYLTREVENVAEFSEIPVGAGQLGLPRIVMATKRGLGVRVSKEMIDENAIGAVNTQITQLTNTFRRADERVLQTLLLDPAIPTIAASAAWDTASGNPRHDIANAMEEVGSATPATATSEDDVFGFMADTLVSPSSLAPVLIDNDNFLSVYKDTLAAESLAYTGTMPRDVMGLASLTSRYWPQDRVLVVERGTVGFYSDTRGLTATGLYPEGNGPNGGPTESWRSDVTRKRTQGLDQPKAACWITGVRS